MNTIENTFRSRFGFHPADSDLFRKLKRLHKWYWQALYDFHRWHRWQRKQEQNRRGPEPQFCPAFVQNEPWYKPIHKKEVSGFKLYPKTVTDFGLVALYHEARQPRPEPVAPFDAQIVACIESLYSQAAAYYER